MTSNGPTTNLAAQPAIAPAVASTTGLRFADFTVDIGGVASHHLTKLLGTFGQDFYLLLWCKERRQLGPTDAQPHSSGRLSEPMCVLLVMQHAVLAGKVVMLSSIHVPSEGHLVHLSVSTDNP